MIEVTWYGNTLVVHGKNKAARVALAGEGHGDGDVVIPRYEIDHVTFKDANALVNGNLTVHTTGGRKYQLHFRRKQRDDFRELAKQLGVVV